MKAKIVSHRYYTLPSGVLVHIERIIVEVDQVIFHRYDTFSNDFMEMGLAERMFHPMFKIGQVAKIVGKSANTLRAYENRGLLPDVRRYSLNAEGTKRIRLYDRKEVEYIIEFFANRPGRGRPKTVGKDFTNKKIAMSKLELRYKGEKNG